MNYCTIWALNVKLKATKGWVNTSSVNLKSITVLVGVRIQTKSNITQEGSKVSFFHPKLKLYRFVHKLYHSTRLCQKQLSRCLFSWSSSLLSFNSSSLSLKSFCFYREMCCGVTTRTSHFFSDNLELLSATSLRVSHSLSIEVRLIFSAASPSSSIFLAFSKFFLA